MGFIGSLFGTRSGNQAGAGLNYAAGTAQQTGLTNPEQIGQAYNNAQGGLSAQGAMNQALAGQNAVQNQSDVYNQAQGLNQALAANNGAQNQAAAYNQTQALNQALAANNGAQNQSDAFARQQAFANAVAAQGGLQNQSSVFGQQQALANQLAAQAQGQGPNPAQAALNQATGQNIASQAALMAGQRGSGSNAGLLARQAAQQGAATQQQAIGQSATMQAQQQLAAQNALANQQAQMAGLATTQAGQQFGANQALASQAAQQIGQQQTQQQLAFQQAAQQVGQQQAQQQLAGQLAGQQVAQQQAGLNAYNQVAGSNLGQMLGAGSAQNQANVAMQGNINNANAGIANTAAQGQQAVAGGLFNALGSAFGMAGAMSKGGMVKGYADGGSVLPATSDDPISIQAPTVANTLQQASGPQSNIGKTLASGGSFQGGFSALGAGNAGAQSINQGLSNLGGGLSKMVGKMGSQGSPMSTGPQGAAMSPVPEGTGAITEGAALPAGAADLAPLAVLASKGGKIGAKEKGKPVPAMVSPGEAYLSPDKVEKVAKTKENPLKEAEKIPGKAAVKGDSKKNDTVPATLQSGGIVIPRSVMNSKDPAKAASKFVSAVLAKQGMKKKAK